MKHSLLSYNNPIGRWAGLGPYYAMFPVDFAFQVIEEFSKPGDVVLDTFAGRASSVYAGAALDRVAYGIEINPVGWLYGHVKLQPASELKVLKRIKEINAVSREFPQENSPEFFTYCFSEKVLSYLLAARKLLKWKTSIIDATVMAIILVNLHGKMGSSLSNQMRQSKAMSPEYSIKWWQAHNLETPPDIDPNQFLTDRVAWRYKKGRPNLTSGNLILGDSTNVVQKVSNKIQQGILNPYNLIFTSPPYYAITNYHYDQWLRLWMLGGPNFPIRLEGEWQKKFESKPGYYKLLKDVFYNAAKGSAPKAVIYVRTDARKYTYETTLSVLQECFPRKDVEVIQRPISKVTQTALFGDKSEKPGEVDIILR